MPILSVIVPVYNEEERIEHCIRSIQNQSITDLEIIVINDGSTDRSLERINHLAFIDRRIKVFSYKNGGTGYALNRGLEHVSGTYIGFSGADDWIESNMFEKLITLMETDHTDVVVCNIIKELPCSSYPVLPFLKHGILSSTLLQRAILMEFDYSICNKLYKKELLVKNSINFEEDLRLSQDALFNFCVFASIKKISITPETFYHYVAKKNSLMSSSQDKRIESLNQIVEYFSNFCVNNSKQREWKIFEEYIGRGYQKYLFNQLLKSDYTNTLGFSKYYRYLITHLKLLNPLLLKQPLDKLSSYQKFRSMLLQNKRFKTFSFLAAVRHKLF